MHPPWARISEYIAVEIVWCKLILIGTLRRRLPEGAVARQFNHERDIVAFDLVLVMDKFTAADVLREVSYCVRTFVLCVTQMNMDCTQQSAQPCCLPPSCQACARQPSTSPTRACSKVIANSDI